MGPRPCFHGVPPGGLPADAQSLASADVSATADIVKQNSVAATTANSQFFVLEYNVLVDMPKYTSYVLGYAIPQFDEWEKAGVLSSYAAYTNQNWRDVADVFVNITLSDPPTRSATGKRTTPTVASPTS